MCISRTSLDVKLPEDDPEAAWRRLGEYQRRYGVLDKGIRILDLRLSDRLMVMPAPSSSRKQTRWRGRIVTRTRSRNIE